MDNISIRSLYRQLLKAARHAHPSQRILRDVIVGQIRAGFRETRNGADEQIVARNLREAETALAKLNALRYEPFRSNSLSNGTLKQAQAHLHTGGANRSPPDAGLRAKAAPPPTPSADVVNVTEEAIVDEAALLQAEVDAWAELERDADEAEAEALASLRRELMSENSLHDIVDFVSLDRMKRIKAWRKMTSARPHSTPSNAGGLQARAPLLTSSNFAPTPSVPLAATSLNGEHLNEHILQSSEKNLVYVNGGSSVSAADTDANASALSGEAARILASYEMYLRWKRQTLPSSDASAGIEEKSSGARRHGAHNWSPEVMQQYRQRVLGLRTPLPVGATAGHVVDDATDESAPKASTVDPNVLYTRLKREMAENCTRPPQSSASSVTSSSSSSSSSSLSDEDRQQMMRRFMMRVTDAQRRASSRSDADAERRASVPPSSRRAEPTADDVGRSALYRRLKMRSLASKLGDAELMKRTEPNAEAAAQADALADSSTRTVLSKADMHEQFRRRHLPKKM